MIVTLGQRVKFTVQVDPEDLDLATEFYWCRSNGYASNPNDDRVRSGLPLHTDAYLHRAIAARIWGEDTIVGMVVDHRDNDRLNNTRENLRLTNAKGNSGNSRLFSTNTSGFKGVSYCSRSRKYKAQIRVNTGKLYLGYYVNAEDAARAYDKAAREYFGEFARVNFPEAGEQGLS